MSFCILYNVVSDNILSAVWGGEESLATNDLMAFELSL